MTKHLGILIAVINNDLAVMMLYDIIITLPVCLVFAFFTGAKLKLLQEQI
jgi:hypothetical protein